MVVNVLILGTPGVGKTLLSSDLATRLGAKYRHIEVAKEVSVHNLHSEFDEERKCTVFDEDAVHDHLEDLINESTDTGWFDVVVMLSASTEAIFDRLSERGYSSEKIRENVECEIFGVIKEELLEILEYSEEEYEAALGRGVVGGLSRDRPAFFEFPHNNLEEHEAVLEKLTRIVTV